MDKSEYYKHSIVYQIYPRSFCDSDGDGIGDLRGIISKLDYLHMLGIGIIWLSPIYPSADVDFGYDISDYYSINPDFGTMEDFENLIEQARMRNIRIVMDMVLNHTSSEHKWFIESSNPESKYRDYYIWRKGRNNNKKPPNNWQSMFTGSAWTYSKETDMYYLHIYTPEQPDLNWKNPEVLKEFEKIIDFWLSKGVYGFRWDSVNSIYKTSLENGKKSAFSRGYEHYMNSEGCHYILHSLYKDVLSKYQIMNVGECNLADFNQVKKFTTEELDMVFTFEHVANKISRIRPFKVLPFKPENLKKAVIRWQSNVDWNANYLENHDQMRSIGKFGNSRKYYKQSAKMLACLVLFLRGTPFIFQGEEIGMLDYRNADITKAKDIVPLNMIKLIKKHHLPLFMAKRMISSFNRDNPRAPFQWDDSVSAGFSSSKDTWLPVNPDYKEINVKSNLRDPTSILNFYLKAVWLRKNEEAFILGDIHFIPSDKRVLYFTRSSMGKTFAVILNLSGKIIRLKEPHSVNVILSNYNKNDYAVITELLPYEALVADLTEK